eukprot:Plantae.Rhodophyta-Rhodochaete_pulchella.ctg4061.p1 GENE.Plantae.Rhodophyta-Rhodochaete_pulchella.ctg4061~~Plantae.Rhodophyta-Rhodochaete_pulchella.ctg4061.p1  ORF type:complete len:402 (-),score=31.70 Plantae.Rhodophyta-Rhodochaete_pulchella.ctg4061:975-2180(-)
MDEGHIVTEEYLHNRDLPDGATMDKATAKKRREALADRTNRSASSAGAAKADARSRDHSHKASGAVAVRQTSPKKTDSCVSEAEPLSSLAEEEVTIFVGNLVPWASDEMIRAVFERYGRIVQIRRKIEKGRNVHRPYAFIRFCEPEAAQAAIVDGHKPTIGGRQVRVRTAVRNTKLFLAGLPSGISEGDISHWLAECAPKNVRLEVHTFAYIEFETREDAEHIKETVKSERNPFPSGVQVRWLDSKDMENIVCIRFTPGTRRVTEEALIEDMKRYGRIYGKSVDPQEGEARVHFARSNSGRFAARTVVDTVSTIAGQPVKCSLYRVPVDGGHAPSFDDGTAVSDTSVDTPHSDPPQFVTAPDYGTSEPYYSPVYISPGTMYWPMYCVHPQPVEGIPYPYHP